MRVKETTTITHVLDGDAGAEHDLERRLFDIGALEIGLKERTHLSVAGTRVLEDDEVDPETSHVHCGWDYDKADSTGDPVMRIGDFFHLKISELVPEIFNRVESNQRGNKQTNPFHTIGQDQ